MYPAVWNKTSQSKNKRKMFTLQGLGAKNNKNKQISCCLHFLLLFPSPSSADPHPAFQLPTGIK
jgi:hypothetical protein